MQFNDRRVLNLFDRRDPSAWGNGVATESATAAVDWATTHVPEHPLIARVRPDNTASVKVAARTGLHRTKHLDTHGEDGLDWIFTLANEPRAVVLNCRHGSEPSRSTGTRCSWLPIRTTSSVPYAIVDTGPFSRTI